jgi:protein subunit release factor B
MWNMRFGWAMILSSHHGIEVSASVQPRRFQLQCKNPTCARKREREREREKERKRERERERERERKRERDWMNNARGFLLRYMRLFPTKADNST